MYGVYMNIFRLEAGMAPSSTPAEGTSELGMGETQIREARRTTSMLDETQQQAIVTRLNRIEGQIRGIRRMVQEPRLCVEILQQLSAAEAALNRISLAVFKFHVEKCVPDGIAKGEPEKSNRLAELVDIFDRFSK
jgi:CsoR family transcriptional regulator, copper-sensing transcriptional repressor